VARSRVKTKVGAAANARRSARVAGGGVHLGAIAHRSQPPYLQALGGEHFYVLLVAGTGDLVRVRCLYADAPATTGQVSDLHLEATDGIRDLWSVLLRMPTRRLRYQFELVGADGTRHWLSERGFAKAAEKHHAGYFHYPYNQPIDRFELPPWIFGATLYEIFPERFWNGDPANDPPQTLAWGRRPTARSFFGGDLAGIRQKIDWLRALGVGALWLTPIFEAPTNHKYDPSDYERIDPAFGTNDEFRALVRELHAIGVRVLLDGVFNHSGAEFFAFRDVREHGTASRHRSWFFNLKGFPVDLRRVNYETFATRLRNHPKLNTADPECARYFAGIGERWIREADIDGWRLDVANEVDHRFWRQFRQTVKAAKPDAFLLGEIWHDAAQWLEGDELDSVMHYPWRDAVLRYLGGEIGPREFAASTTRLRHFYHLIANAGLVHLLGSHDTARVRTELGSAAKARQGAALLLTAAGMPLVYYGDEVGMEGGDDPDCRRCMVWDEEQQDRELLRTYRTLIRVRRERPWLAWGDFEDLVVDDERELYAYARRARGPLGVPFGTGQTVRSEEALYVALNTGTRRAQVTLEVAGRRLAEVLSGRRVEVERGRTSVELPGRGVAVLVPE
jgi:cyclomaltodextrinase